MLDEQRGIAKNQRSLDTCLKIASTRLDQLSPALANGFEDAARKQDRITNSLILLHNTQCSLTDGQNQITRELATSAGRKQAAVTALSNARDIAMEIRSTSMAQTQSQVNSYQHICRTADAHSDALERLYQAVDAVRAQHQERYGAPEPSLHMRLRLPQTQIIMELIIRRGHDKSDRVALLDLIVSSGYP
jgi:hypothetical protein